PQLPDHGHLDEPDRDRLWQRSDRLRHELRVPERKRDPRRHDFPAVDRRQTFPDSHLGPDRPPEPDGSMKHLPRRDSERGMSLIEVMVALIVSAIGLFGALALIGTLLKGGDFSRRMTEASVLGQYKLEEMVSWQYSCIATSVQAGCPAT